jgi:predicted ATPase
VDLMVGKLSRLPVETQSALKQLACLGISVESGTLAMVYPDAEEMHGTFWEAVRTGLVFRSYGGYRFLHDRVQEAAYSLIADAARAAVHLRLGRLLAARVASADLEDKVFEIVNQFNRAPDLVTSVEERHQVAELNLVAAKRAKASTAYASALAYLAAGRALLAEEDWERRYELVFALEFHTAECEVLSADLAAGRRSARGTGTPGERPRAHRRHRAFAPHALHDA